MYCLGPGTIVWLCTLCIDVNRRNVDPRQGLGDAWQTYVNAGDFLRNFSHVPQPYPLAPVVSVTVEGVRNFPRLVRGVECQGSPVACGDPLVE